MPRSVEGGWEIGGFAYAENPRFTCPRWALALMEAWARLRSARGGGMQGMGSQVLPRGGGYLDQPALAMEAFELFDRWLQEERQGELET